MTDPIRIPIDGSHGAQDAWQHTLTIDADLARRIVALAGIRVCDIADDDEESAEPWDVRARSDAWCAVVKTLERYGEVLINQPEPNGVLAACGIIDRMIMKRNHLEGKLAKAEDERDKALADLAAAQKRLADYDDRLTAVMPADYKDWHKNSRNEWPLVAAELLHDRGEQRDEAEADLAAERDAKNRALTCAADYAEEVTKLKARIERLQIDLTDESERADENASLLNETVGECQAILAAQPGEDVTDVCRRVMADLAALTAQRDRLAGLLRDSVPMLTAYKASLDSKGEAYEDKASRVGYQLMHTKAALAELEKNQ